MAADRATLTILFTDAVGSTAVATAEGDEQAAKVLGHSARLAREAVIEHGGREVKRLGDGSLCSFRGPQAAVAAAAAIQRAHSEWAANEEAAIPVRIGIHTGEVDEDDGDLGGEAVSAAARICASAAGGEILISATAAGAAGAGAGLRLSAREPIELKGFPEPFEVAAVDWKHDDRSEPAPVEQRIRFSKIEGQRIAWSAIGDGPPLVVPSPWVSNLHSDWENEEYRRFLERLAAEHTVIRYDRPGTGLSDRSLPENPSLDHDVLILEGLLADLDVGPAALFGISCGGCIALGFAARNPAATTALVFAGCYADGSRLASPAVRDSLVSVIRANWGLGARMLSDIFVPGGSPAERRAWAQFQRDSADAEEAAELYELIYSYDASRAVEHADAPALVLHRRDDTAVDFKLGRELAAGLPNARLLPLEGMRHLPWQGDTEPILNETIAFLADHAGDGNPSPSPSAGMPDPEPAARPGIRGPISLPELSAREAEVLQLVSGGLSDREIAERLVLSPHTVHRHVANIRTKLGQPSRAAAVAHAARLELL